MRIIITGANSGVGQATAAALAGAGHQVTIACRTIAKGRLAAAEMTGEVEVRELDLADLASVHRFADSVDHVDVLVNNAGVLGLPLTRTVDGFEAHMGTNHLGHFALTCLLAPRVCDRVVVLTSGTYALARLHAGDLNWRRRRYNKWLAYAESKLANALFVQGLVNRGRKAYAVDPGFVKSGITRDMTGLLAWTNETISSKFAQSPDQGARPTVRAATANLPNGACLAPRGPLHLWGTSNVGQLHAKARDSQSARELWDASVELTGCRWPGE
jgi:NAD(P)-dependent dehydrogenase (short-subunit alcohol dehydrogenase family)